MLDPKETVDVWFEGPVAVVCVIDNLPQHLYVLASKRATSACTPDVQYEQASETAAILGKFDGPDTPKNALIAMHDFELKYAKHTSEAVLHEINAAQSAGKSYSDFVAEANNLLVGMARSLAGSYDSYINAVKRKTEKNIDHINELLSDEIQVRCQSYWANHLATTKKNEDA